MSDLSERQVLKLAGGMLGVLVTTTNDPQLVRRVLAWYVNTEHFWEAFERGDIEAAVEPIVQAVLDRKRESGN